MLRTLAVLIFKKSKLARFYWLKYHWYKAKKNMKFTDEEFIKKEYYEKLGKHLNLDNPKTYDEKLSWLKLANHDPLLTLCTDKYRVREYVQDCELGHILTRLYGVYDDADEVDFSTFKPVFLKCNHTSGDNAFIIRINGLIERNSSELPIIFLKQNYYFQHREWNYKDIKPKIIAEEVLLNEDES